LSLPRVRVHFAPSVHSGGGVAQLGEHYVRNIGVEKSPSQRPSSRTKLAQRRRRSICPTKASAVTYGCLPAAIISTIFGTRNESRLTWSPMIVAAAPSGTAALFSAPLIQLR